MNVYRIISKAYDLLDTVYFSEKGRNPREVINAMIPQKPLKVLDLCCGTLSNSIAVAKENKNSRVVGVDLSREMLSIAKEKITRSDLRNVCLRRADATNTNIESNSFDIVIIGLILHECSPQLAKGIMKEAYRMLKDDGRLIILEWDKPHKPLQIIKFAPIYLMEVMGCTTFKKFYLEDKKRLFEKYGFKTVMEEKCNYTAVYCLEKGDMGV